MSKFVTHESTGFTLCHLCGHEHMLHDKDDNCPRSKAPPPANPSNEMRCKKCGSASARAGHSEDGFTLERCSDCPREPRPTSNEQKAEEYPPRSQWTDAEREKLKTQTIPEMYHIACVPEHYSLVFRNIAHRGGWKEVLGAQYDALWREMAEWVSGLGDKRRDSYNDRIMERNRERESLRARCAELEATVAWLRGALERIMEHTLAGVIRIESGQPSKIDCVVIDNIARNALYPPNAALRESPAHKGEE